MTIKNENVIITPARLCHEQRISLVPIAHHYEAPGEPKYIKYGCPICESVKTEAKKAVAKAQIDDPDLHFYSHQVMYGRDCPICGIHLAWNKLKPEDDDGGAMPIFSEF